MEISCLEKEGVLTLVLNGRLDSAGAIQLDREIDKIISRINDKLILDYAGVPYVNSSALRVVIKYAKELRESGKEFHMVNVNSDVYKVFKLTGFTSIIHIVRRENEIEP
ncbi:STAS domain-containing protein [Candidatus Formimonas warabiya]|uniref:Anti-sigma factor antagonist n=1 Tax=Formimonas warabiya TaxID=1761012 RepID=A0A3G1KSU3_FORW1|nr:STAS domain-containing protein [Candidatus Formimonas warabiya]ATW25245.1 hypothetical protein DCMF_11120 [Candidatus Formimonas warabiya]